MTYVYESPDGGNTVYRREIGSTDRELHSISVEQHRCNQQTEKETLWQKIIQSGDTNPALQKALEQARLIYELSQTND